MSLCLAFKVMQAKSTIFHITVQEYLTWFLIEILIDIGFNLAGNGLDIPNS